MIEMETWLATILLFSSLFLLLLTGLPVAFVLGSVTIIFTYLLWGPSGINIFISRTFDSMTGFVLLAIGLFVLMAQILAKSGVAEKLFDAMYHWFGSFRGGLAQGTVVICALFAAMCGISGAATVTMGIIALPAMLSHGYDKRIAMGCIQGGGALGILIPPSAPMIIFCLLGNQSVGKLFAAGILPGLAMTFIFMMYIAIRTMLNKNLCPVIPVNERVGLKTKINLSKGLILPVLLVIVVLGSIFSGMATPAEAAAVGVFGSLICAAVYKKFNWKLLKDTSYEAMGLTCMIMWIMMAASCFSGLYNGINAPAMVNDLISSLEINKWLILIIMQVILLFLGCFLEPTSIMFITVPVFLPIVKLLGFDPIWFGILFIMNMEMSYLTPPFGFNLFYMRGVAPSDIPMMEIYKSALPFVGMQILSLILIMLFPQIALLLPHLIFGHPM